MKNKNRYIWKEPIKNLRNEKYNYWNENSTESKVYIGLSWQENKWVGTQLICMKNSTRMHHRKNELKKWKGSLREIKDWVTSTYI